MRLTVLVLIMATGCYSLLFAQSQEVVADSLAARIAPVLLHERVITDVLIKVSDSIAFRQWAEQNHSAIAFHKVGPNLYSLSGLTQDSFIKLQTSAGVGFIDRANRRAKEETVLGDFDQSVNSVTSIHSLYPALNGAGLTVSVKEKPFNQFDLDVRGRVVLNDQFDEPASLHATFMATIAAGAGNTTPFAKGAGWGAGITTSDFDRLLPDNGNTLTSLKVTVQNHSYGVGLENYYGIESSEYDLQGRQYSKILHVFSSGNAGGSTPVDGPYAGVTGFANLTGQFKVSKNTISVGSADRLGNIISLSSRGPAHDGRVKPELIAFGDAGSSEAAAVVSGITLVVQQAYSDSYDEIPDAALVKAILINSAQDVGRPQVDYETGFGNVDALAAVRTVKQGSFFTGSVNENEEAVFTINVPASQGHLKVTLAWADPPADPFASQALINDIDLVVKYVPTNEVWNPWVLNGAPTREAIQQNAQRGIDRLNNVEQVTIDAPAAGEYELRLTGFSIPQGPQTFYVVYEFQSGFEWRYPLINDALRSGTTSIIRWQWYDHAAAGKLEFKYASETSWREISSTINLEQRAYEWAAPDTSALLQFRIGVNNESYETSVIALSKPERVQVGFDCDDEVMVLWNKVPSADEYVLYTLGDLYLEPLLTTSDTFAIVPKALLESNYFSVAPVLNGVTGNRELTIEYTQQGTGCYFISFIPRETIVSDKAMFDITLGTTYNVQSATLERLVNGRYMPVETIEKLTNNTFMLQDLNPLPETQTYRVKLTTTNQQLIFSNEVQIFYIQERDVYVFPNPIVAGDLLSVLTSDDDFALLQIMDIHGRVLREAEDFGLVKSIETEDMIAGTYLVRILQQDGREWVKRVVVVK